MIFNYLIPYYMNLVRRLWKGNIIHGCYTRVSNQQKYPNIKKRLNFIFWRYYQTILKTSFFFWCLKRFNSNAILWFNYFWLNIERIVVLQVQEISVNSSIYCFSYSLFLFLLILFVDLIIRTFFFYYRSILLRGFCHLYFIYMYINYIIILAPLYTIKAFFFLNDAELLFSSLNLSLGTFVFSLSFLFHLFIIGPN